MAKFSMRNFVMSTLRRMVSGGETDYKVMQYAAGWYDKEVLIDEDMMEITALIEARDVPKEEPVNVDTGDSIIETV